MLVKNSQLMLFVLRPNKPHKCALWAERRHF